MTKESALQKPFALTTPIVGKLSGIKKKTAVKTIRDPLFCQLHTGPQPELSGIQKCYKKL